MSCHETPNSRSPAASAFAIPQTTSPNGTPRGTWLWGSKKTSTCLTPSAAARRRYAEAGELYAQVLASREALLGPEDPAVASALFNQAALAARRGMRGEARERLQRAAAVREFALGARSAELAELNAALALFARPPRSW